VVGKEIAVKKYVVRLSAEERAQLDELIRKGKPMLFDPACFARSHDCCGPRRPPLPCPTVALIASKEPCTSFAPIQFH
jgi:hypothetical protein